MDNLYKRMVLLPEQEYVDMKHCNLSTDTNAAASAANATIWPSENSSEREVKLYALQLAKQRESDQGGATPSASATTSSSTTVSVAPDFSREILLLPTGYRARAQRMYILLEKYRPSLLNWDTSGEVIFDRHSVPLHGSNLIDLIQHATSVPKRRNYTPTGWNEFVAIIKRINVPMAILNKETQEEVNGTQTGKGLVVKQVSSPIKRVRKQIAKTVTSKKKKLKTKNWIHV